MTAPFLYSGARNELFGVLIVKVRLILPELLPVAHVTSHLGYLSPFSVFNWHRECLVFYSSPGCLFLLRLHTQRFIYTSSWGALQRESELARYCYDSEWFPGTFVQIPMTSSSLYLFLWANQNHTNETNFVVISKSVLIHSSSYL